MGCASSKRAKATVDIYHPPPTSFAVFDINAIEEPWLVDHASLEQQEKQTHVPAKILEKLNAFEAEVPHSWDEVSKALEDLKTNINDAANNINYKKLAPEEQDSNKKQNFPRKSSTFHTVEELDAKLSSPKPAATEVRKAQPIPIREASKADSELSERVEAPAPGATGFKSVKENIFIMRDRLEREREGRMANYDKIMSKRDPLSEFPEKCPPAGAESVVVYTTSLRGVRRTHEDCLRVKGILEIQRVVFDERDVSLHGEFLSELKELVGEGVSVPRVFVKGRYLGGAEEVSELNESGRLGRILNQARVERGVGRQACGGCGGLRFVPCLECGGSCKVVVEGDKRERCGQCNENGLVHCPACLNI